MKLKTLEKYDKGKVEVNCPKCKKPLQKLICPPKRIYIH